MPRRDPGVTFRHRCRSSRPKLFELRGGAPRVAPGRRGAPPNFFYKHEVDITITLYFRVRVPVRSGSCLPHRHTPRLPCEAGAAKQREAPAVAAPQNYRPSSRSWVLVEVESTPSTG